VLVEAKGSAAGGVAAVANRPPPARRSRDPSALQTRLSEASGAAARHTPASAS